MIALASNRNKNSQIYLAMQIKLVMIVPMLGTSSRTTHQANSMTRNSFIVQIKFLRCLRIKNLIYLEMIAPLLTLSHSPLILQATYLEDYLTSTLLINHNLLLMAMIKTNKHLNNKRNKLMLK